MTAGTLAATPLSAAALEPLLGTSHLRQTYVVQMNLADSERMAGVLESVGYECSEDPAKADVLIYNTCSIREKAEVKVYSALGKQVGFHVQQLANMSAHQTVRQTVRQPVRLTVRSSKFPACSHAPGCCKSMCCMCSDAVSRYLGLFVSLFDAYRPNVNGIAWVT